MTALAPLVARYTGSGPLQVPPEIPPEPDGIVRAMPVVLRLERPPAARTPVLEAAARAALAVCLDPRSEPGGEWHEAVAVWIGSRIRKIARRARGAHWAAVQPDAEALTYGGMRWTWGQWHDRIRRGAGGLAALGLGRGGAGLAAVGPGQLRLRRALVPQGRGLERRRRGRRQNRPRSCAELAQGRRVC